MKVAGGTSPPVVVDVLIPADFGLGAKALDKLDNATVASNRNASELVAAPTPTPRR